jgi:ATP-dependent Lhr-like helicase
VQDGTSVSGGNGDGELDGGLTATERRLALVEGLLDRYGVIVRELTAHEFVPGGFSALYPVLKRLEDAGRVRRGYFVEGLGATQFALPGAASSLRSLAQLPAEQEEWLLLSATDPACPYGSLLPWPASEGRPQRTAGALVVLHGGQLIAYLNRAGDAVWTWLPDPGPAAAARRLAQRLAREVDDGHRRAWLIREVNGGPADACEFVEEFRKAGFVRTSRGLMRRATDVR